MKEFLFLSDGMGYVPNEDSKDGYVVVTIPSCRQTSHPIHSISQMRSAKDNMNMLTSKKNSSIT